MVMHYIKKKIVRRRIDSLKPHPRQAEVFSAVPRKQLDKLAASMKHGLCNPVEITSAGVIICGHQRVAAAGLLGWTEIPCWVRSDLEAQGDDAIFRRLVEDNLGRRHLTKIGMGRAFLAIKNKEYEGWRSNKMARGDFRDHVGEILGVDGTTAERLAHLAGLPIEYDALIESGVLTQQLAHRITKLSAGVQEKLGRQLSAIAESDFSRKDKKKKVKAVVEKTAGPRKKTRTKSAPAWHQQFSRTIKQALKKVPAPIAASAVQLADRQGDLVIARTLRRTFASELAGFDGLDIELDEESITTLQQGLLLIVGTLIKANAEQEEE